MERDKPKTEDREDRAKSGTDKDAAPETDKHPVEGVEHEPEPDAENIMPVKDGPGTL